MSLSESKKITTIILNYKKAARVVESVGFLLSQKQNVIQNKIIVVDNSCDKNEEEILRTGLENLSENVSLVINKTNLGYIKGYNIVNNQIEGDYVLIVNPDILFKENDSLEKMATFMQQHPNVGLLGPKQINDDGTLAMSVRAFPKFYIQIARRTFLRSLPFLKRKVAYDEMKHLDYDKIQDVDWLQSSCVMIRRDFWEKVRGFDESYFLFMADTEMSLAAWKLGLRSVYFSETSVYADGKRLSAGGVLDFFKSWILRAHVKDSLKYTIRHFLTPNPRKQFYENNPDQNR
jgi:N-acetylglucosaminyl-diphospho-decaprenol L-rhamnosyltransferase